jgi:hypothetical protein
VPTSAADTAAPSSAAESANVPRSASVTPAITAVSKPNSSPAKLAATIAEGLSLPLVALIAILSSAVELCNLHY